MAVGRAYLLPPLSSGGASLARPWLRFHIPLIEPDWRISRIRLSDKTSRLRPRLAAPSRGQAYETVMPVEVREWIRPAGIVNLSGCSMLVVSVARQLRSGNSFAHLEKIGISDMVGRPLLFVEPDRPQILIDVMARTHFPAFNIASVGHDAVPPQQEDFVGLGIKDQRFELAHELPLSCEIGLPQHTL